MAEKGSVGPTGVGHRWLLPGTALAVVVLVSAAILRVPPDATRYERVAVAVFPFELEGGIGDTLSDTVARALRAQLRGEPGVIIVDGVDTIPPGADRVMAASNLGADFLVVGTIRVDSVNGGGGRFRVTPHVIRTADGAPVWSKPYALNGLGGMVAVMDEVAAAMAAALTGAPDSP